MDESALHGTSCTQMIPLVRQASIQVMVVNLDGGARLQCGGLKERQVQLGQPCSSLAQLLAGAGIEQVVCHSG